MFPYLTSMDRRSAGVWGREVTVESGRTVQIVAWSAEGLCDMV